MKKVGAVRKTPKYTFHFDRRDVLYMDGEKGHWMGISQVSSWAIKKYGYHIHFLGTCGPFSRSPSSPLHIVFHIPTGLPLSVHEDEKSARVAVKRLESGIDPAPTLDQIDLTPRKWSNTNDDVPF